MHRSALRRGFSTAEDHKLPRLSHQGKRIRLRGYTVVRDNIQLSVTPVPALYKENEHSWSLDKNGYISFEFLPMTKSASGEGVLDLEKRKSVIVTLKNVREVLDLDASDAGTKSENAFVAFKRSSEDSKYATMTIKRTGDTFEFSAGTVDTASEKVESTHKIALTLAEVRNLQLLVSFAVPSLLGWNALYHPTTVCP